MCGLFAGGRAVRGTRLESASTGTVPQGVTRMDKPLGRNWSLLNKRSKRPSFRPDIEHLESREVPTTLPSGFTETTVATGISGPTAMEFSPDGRLWVLEQGGNVKLVHSDGTTF